MVLFLIKVEISTAILLYFGSLLLFFLGLWMFYHLKSRKKTAFTPLKELAACEYCHFAYLAPPEKLLSRCPQCGALNKRS